MKSFIVVIALVATIAFPQTVFASSEECSTSTGSYGQTTTTCKVLGQTITTHEVVSTGIGDVSIWTVAGILTIVSGAFFGIAKLVERTYWFD